MPELPEVEAVVRGVREAAPWEQITAWGQSRPGIVTGGGRAVGRKVVAAGRRGKNILVRLSGGAFLRVHLKMTGHLTVLPEAGLRPRSVRAWFPLASGRALALDDPRALGRIWFHREQDEEDLFRLLGPEPFDPAFTPEGLAASARCSAKPIKLLLMEQKAVAGLGNIYAAEALFRAGIDPRRPACRLSRARAGGLHAAILDVLGAALESVQAAYRQPGGFNQDEFYPVAVYGREGAPCPACGAAVRRIRQGGRSTYYCPKCQK